MCIRTSHLNLSVSHLNPFSKVRLYPRFSMSINMDREQVAQWIATSIASRRCFGYWTCLQQSHGTKHCCCITDASKTNVQTIFKRCYKMI
jgi:hypothetical protein